IAQFDRTATLIFDGEVWSHLTNVDDTRGSNPCCLFVDKVARNHCDNQKKDDSLDPLAHSPYFSALCIPRIDMLLQQVRRYCTLAEHAVMKLPDVKPWIFHLFPCPVLSITHSAGMAVTVSVLGSGSLG